VLDRGGREIQECRRPPDRHARRIQDCR
jgi:hypothetical protein